jgi:hypothetical protein
MLKDEIWGCTHYMKLPMETVMKLPVHDRHYFIQKHNEEQQGIRATIDKRSNKGNAITDAETINRYAKLEQENIKNMKGRY